MKMKIQKFLTLMSIESQCSFVKVFSNRFQVKSMFAMRKKKNAKNTNFRIFAHFQGTPRPSQGTPFWPLGLFKKLWTPPLTPSLLWESLSEDGIEVISFDNLPSSIFAFKT